MRRFFRSEPTGDKCISEAKETVAMPPDTSQLGWQMVWLFALAIPVSSVAWTVTHEEVFREPREYCQRRSRDCRRLLARKFFYLFTCEYCFSHWITPLALIFTGYKFLMDDWRGYVLAFFAIVWVSNIYMSLYSRLRVDISSERAVRLEREKEAELHEQRARAIKEELE